jgi:hypothetical protein
MATGQNIKWITTKTSALAVNGMTDNNVPETGFALYAGSGLVKLQTSCGTVVSDGLSRLSV